jgi:hypothetical protein
MFTHYELSNTTTYATSGRETLHLYHLGAIVILEKCSVCQYNVELFTISFLIVAYAPLAAPPSFQEVLYTQIHQPAILVQVTKSARWSTRPGHDQVSNVQHKYRRRASQANSGSRPPAQRQLPGLLDILDGKCILHVTDCVWVPYKHRLLRLLLLEV